MSYEEYRDEVTQSLASARPKMGDDRRDEIANAQVLATLALAEAIREGLGALNR